MRIYLQTTDEDFIDRLKRKYRRRGLSVHFSSTYFRFRSERYEEVYRIYKRAYEKYLRHLKTVPTVEITQADVRFYRTILTAKVTDLGNDDISSVGFRYQFGDPLLTSPTVVTVELDTSDNTFRTPTLETTDEDLYIQPFAVNSAGTSEAEVFTVFSTICLAEGTMVTLADRRTKPIEDIQYTDELLVWDFDRGCFSSAKPLWIKRPELTDRYNELRFEDGSVIRAVNQHRVFNADRGAFTPCMKDDSPLGMTTMTAAGGSTRLAGKRVVHERVRYYNVITDYHMNLFADGVLTSCRYNNVYPIRGGKFVKPSASVPAREKAARSDGIPEAFHRGLRLAEQSIPAERTAEYVRRLLQSQSPMSL